MKMDMVSALPKVIVFEDSETDRDYFKRIAKGICDPNFTSSMKDAQILLLAGGFEVIFIDQIILGRVEEGVELLLFILSHHVNIKTILLSGASSFSAVTTARVLEADYSVEKPITKEFLIQVLRHKKERGVAPKW